MKKKRISSGVMRARVWPVLMEAIETGINIGWNRARKHTDTPSENAIKEALLVAISTELAEKFDIDEVNNGT